jgi:hypothetical protein
MIESDMLSYIKRHQKELRDDKHSSLHHSITNADTQGAYRGKLVFSSTFVGGRRYIDQLYFDGRVICGAIGYLDLFLTLTCNPNWPKI